MDFKNANELLTLCEEQNISISEVMRNREIITGECPAKEVDQKMARVLEIMKEAARSPIEKPIRSMGRADRRRGAKTCTAFCQWSGTVR